MPLVLPLLSPAAFPDPQWIAITLVLLLFVPLVLALFARSRYPDTTTKRAPLATKLSAIGLGAVLVGFLGAVVFGFLIGEAQLDPGLFLSWAILAAIVLLLVQLLEAATARLIVGPFSLACQTLIMPSPATVHKVDILTRLDMAQPSSSARIFDTIQAAPAASEAGSEMPYPRGKK
jgi:predicted Na+-dependent transporter